MENKETHNTNQERIILEAPLLSINKDDNTTFDVGSYKVYVIDKLNTSDPEGWVEEFKKQMGVKQVDAEWKGSKGCYVGDNGYLQKYNK